MFFDVTSRLAYTIRMYDDVSPAIREDLVQSHQRAWQRLAGAGTWHRGETRVAIAAEVRNAPTCLLCQNRKAALSPFAVAGAHDHTSDLPNVVVEVIHRVVTDPARLTRSWFDGVRADLSDTDYVEIIGVIAQVIAIDTFSRGIGIDPRPLPEPTPGEPARKRPHGAADNGSWVPTIVPGDHGPDEADIFDHAPRSNIVSALSLVPDELRGFFDLVNTQYLPGPAMRDFATEYRAITHAQIELVASRVSAINACFY